MRLRQIIDETVKRTLNEISSEKKAAAFVKANHDLHNLNKSNDAVATNFNGNKVHNLTQSLRRDRQKQAFKNGLINDLQKKFNTHDIRLNAYNYDDDTQFSVTYDDDKFHHYSNTSGTERDSSFHPRDRKVDHRDMKAADYLTNMVDAMAGYDSELKGHKPYKSELASVNDRANDVENLQKYYQDVEDYEQRKDVNRREMDSYNSAPWYSKLFKKKPLPFTLQKPQPPQNKTGVYFMPRTPDVLYKQAERIKGTHQNNMDAYNRFFKKSRS